MSLTEQFDASIVSTVKERGNLYSHPSVDFARVALIKRAVADCPNPKIRHALEMIGVKMARLAVTPDHFDSIIDIAGYARTIAMILDRDA